MSTPTVHRIIEQHASTRGTALAVSDGERTLNYRDLNYAANMLARRLQTAGFRRGTHATISMPCGIDLAPTLLAVLKMGGCYTWQPAGAFTAEPIGLSFAVPTRSRGDLAAITSGDSAPNESRHLFLDLSEVFAGPVTCSPNLPVVTRASDIACVLQTADGSPAVLVPHATITALRERAVLQPTLWRGEPGAFDLWMALLTGTTAVVDSGAAAVAA